MEKQLLLILNLFLCILLNAQNTGKEVKIGIFADCQYCDCNTAGTRFYRNSLDKLESCISHFNRTADLNFIAGLGDLIDRDLKSYDAVNDILSKSKHPLFQVKGNHDLSVENDDLIHVPAKLNLTNTYYSHTEGNWRFIFLDGNDITFHSNDPKIVAEAERMVHKLKQANRPNSKEWNGGIGKKQIKWLTKQLKESKKNGQSVVIFCHYPILPLEAHVFWNSEEILELLDKHNNVKAWINGHNHKGNYAVQKGMHCITLQGMVETQDENSYCILKLSENKLVIEGFGRETDRDLPLE